MSLYLCVFDVEAEEEYGAVEIGPYSYFGELRDLVLRALSVDRETYPNFLAHSDSSGSWAGAEVDDLRLELSQIRARLEQRAPQPITNDQWYLNIYFSKRPQNLAECAFDVDGANLFDSLTELCAEASKRCLPILFQ